MTFNLTALICASALADLIVALVALFGVQRRTGESLPRTIDFFRVAVAAVATSAFFLLKLPVLMLLGINLFGIMNLVYIDLVVVIPMLGLIVQAAMRASVTSRWSIRTTKPVKALAVLALFGAPIGVYATAIEPFDLRVERAHLTPSPQRKGAAPLRIAVLADLQTGRITKYEQSAVEQLMSKQPDLILIPGDIFQSQGSAFEDVCDDFRALFARLSAPAGVYCVLGDVDSPQRLRRVFEGTNVRLLVNEIAQVAYADRLVTIGGVELRYDTPEAHQVISELERSAGHDDIRILVSHRPDVVELLSAGSRVDLVVAGHTHGGQVVVPLYGPPITLSHVPRHVAAGGLHFMNDHWIYVSRGVGCERGQAPRVRFLCPPEISIINIR